MPFQYNPVLDGLYSPTQGSRGYEDSSFTWHTVSATDRTVLLPNGTGIITRSNLPIEINLQFDTSINNRRSQIIGAGTGLWTLKLLPGQILQFGNSTITTSVAATEPSDCLDLIYVGNNIWAQSSSVGNLNLT